MEKKATLFRNCEATLLKGFVWHIHRSSWLGFGQTDSSNFLIQLDSQGNTRKFELEFPTSAVVLTQNKNVVLLSREQNLVFYDLISGENFPFLDRHFDVDVGFFGALHPRLIGAWPSRNSGRFKIATPKKETSHLVFGARSSPGFAVYQNRIYFLGASGASLDSIYSYPLSGENPAVESHFTMAMPRWTSGKGNPTPSCMQIDAAGNFWIGWYNSGLVSQLSPTGEHLNEYRIPDGIEVTSLAFGGSDLRTLLIAVSDQQSDAMLAEGQFFTATTEVPGLPPAHLHVSRQ